MSVMKWCRVSRFSFLVITNCPFLANFSSMQTTKTKQCWSILWHHNFIPDYATEFHLAAQAKTWLSGFQTLVQRELAGQSNWRKHVLKSRKKKKQTTFWRLFSENDSLHSRLENSVYMFTTEEVQGGINCCSWVFQTAQFADTSNGWI